MTQTGQTAPNVAGKGSDTSLLNDLARLPEAVSSGNGSSAKDFLLDTLLRRAKSAAGRSDFDLLNRLELEYGLSEGGLEKYSLWSILPLYVSPSNTHNVFLQGGYTNIDGRDTGGGDLVYRFMTEDAQALYGAHFGFDHQWPYHHSRLAFGLDYKTSQFGARLSHYLGTSEWKNGETGFEEKPMDGTDLELSGRVPNLPELELFTRGFHWIPDDDALTNDGDEIWGYEVASEYTPINAVTLRGSISDDNDRKSPSAQMTIRLNYRLGMGWSEMISRPVYDLASVSERRFDRVRRERTMQIQTRSRSLVAAPSGPDCPNIGDTCADGSIFAGLSPDGNVRLFTTPADAPSFAFNDGNANFTDTTMTNCTGLEASCVTGEANTGLLTAEDSNSVLAGIQSHNAAQYCADLVSHGKSDWYLPAQEELLVLYENLVDQNGDTTPGGPLGTTYGFNISGLGAAGFYSSSSENSINLSRLVRFSDGFVTIGTKSTSTFSLRCVRKD